jgi:hypothetical protein
MKGSGVEMSHLRQTTHNTLLPGDENPPYVIQVTMFRHDMPTLLIAMQLRKPAPANSPRPHKETGQSPGLPHRTAGVRRLRK